MYSFSIRINDILVGGLVRQYPKEPKAYGNPHIAYDISGKIYLEANGQTLKYNPNAQMLTKDNCVEEYLWFFFDGMLDSVFEIQKGNSYKLGFADSANSMIIKPIKEKVSITFQAPILKLSGDSMYKPINNARVPIKLFTKEVVKSTQKFIDELKKINPKIVDSSEIQTLLNKIENLKAHGKSP